VVRRSTVEPIRVAVLGGGVGALTAAYELSHPRHNGQFLVTIYQLGWRLGGKCASGRDVDHNMRITEHGPHVLFGFYDNAFEMMEECYAALHRPAEHPFRTFTDALIGSNGVSVMEQTDRGWLPWQMPVVALPGKPGAVGAFSRWDIVINAIDRLADHVRAGVGVFAGTDRKAMSQGDAERALRSLETTIKFYCDQNVFTETKRRIKVLESAVGSPEFRTQILGPTLNLMVDAISSAQKHAREIKITRGQVPHHDAVALAAQLRVTQKLTQLVPTIVDPSNEARHWIILTDLGATVLLGATVDELLLPTRQSLTAANRYEFREWLGLFGALRLSIDSAVVRAMYDTVFGYVGGDPARGGDVEAGYAVRAHIDMVSCRGSFIWKMRAGTGDVIAAPLYQYLCERGVKFEFFRQVDSLTPSRDGDSISEVHLISQAEVVNPPYRPLLDCKGITVWPDRPDLAQLDQNPDYEGLDFESYWAPQGQRRLVLTAGVDFDAIVLGIGLGALPTICDSLQRVNAKWAKMFATGESVATQSAQFWLDEPTEASGWPGPPNPVMTSFDATSIDTWLDASHVIQFEDWTSDGPAQMAMVCGPFPGHQCIPNQGQSTYPQTCDSQVAENSRQFLAAADALWPNFDPDQLRGNFCHPGINPSDRYVRTPRNSSQFRLAPDQSGFSNLILTGDWTDNGLNLGCFEAAVVSGRLAANALGGVPRPILREVSGGPSTGPTSAGPRYVEHHPPQTMSGPVVFPDVTMWAFLLRGDLAALTKICRRFFDISTNGQITFVPLSPIVVMTISEFRHAYFRDAADRGRSTEREVAFGIPGAYTCRDAVGNVSGSGAATFMPYLFVDNPVALITGREVLGYFKQLGEVGLPGRAGGTNDFFLNVFGAEKMAPNVEWSEQRLLTLTACDDPLISGSRAVSPRAVILDFDGNRSPWTRTFQAIFKKISSSGVPGSSALANFDVRGLASGSMSQIFLKQFRSEVSGHSAAYQAVTMAEYSVTRIHYVRPTQSYNIVIHPLESLPLAKELGLSSEMVEIGFEVNFDMTLGSGRVLWKA
jgi:uncharacterized protein with NAD-binding domain and iron-sulfur cluster